ncbi:unnamed protein product [Brassica oleracea]
MSIAREVSAVNRLGIKVAIVVGGGNIFRGSTWSGCSGFDCSSTDCIGIKSILDFLVPDECVFFVEFHQW